MGTQQLTLWPCRQAGQPGLEVHEEPYRDYWEGHAETVQEYLRRVDEALRVNASWFPHDAELREQRVRYLARSIGRALAEYDRTEVARELSATYSTLLIRHTFDSVGATLDNAEWLAEIRGAMESAS